jgi:hypothetical protein
MISPEVITLEKSQSHYKWPHPTNASASISLFNLPTTLHGNTALCS